MSIKIDVDGYLSNQWEQHCREQEEFDQLVDQVIEQIKVDVEEGDFTAIAELLQFVPRKYLIGYLPEEPNNVRGEE